MHAFKALKTVAYFGLECDVTLAQELRERKASQGRSTLRLKKGAPIFTKEEKSEFGNVHMGKYELSRQKDTSQLVFFSSLFLLALSPPRTPTQTQSPALEKVREVPADFSPQKS